MEVSSSASPAAPATPTPTPSSALETMKDWFATVDGERLLAEEIEWKVPGYPVPRDTYIGREAVLKEFFPALMKQFSTWGAEPNRMIEGKEANENGEVDVTVTGHYVGTTLGTQRNVRIPFIHVWTVRQGKIVRVITSADTKPFHEAAQDTM